LSVVRSIARRSAETSTSVEEYASHLDGRLNAFARTQAVVTRDPESGVDLEYLIVEELLVYNVREGEQLRISGPTMRLQPKAAETFALAIHELATNAIKYGALSQPAGRIDICWRADNAAEPAQLIFAWREKGGPLVLFFDPNRGCMDAGPLRSTCCTARPRWGPRAHRLRGN